MPQYYYADASKSSVGPISLEELRELHSAGVVANDTAVIEAGATKWGRYSDFVRASNEPGLAPPPPPPPTELRSQEDIVRERVAAGATRATAFASTTASVVQRSVLQTFQGAVSVGERAVVFATIVGMVAFPLPWVSAFGSGVSGFSLARDAAGLLWLLPISLLGCFFLSYLNVGSTRRRRLLRARWFLLVGTFWATVALLATVLGRQLFGVAAVGLYLTLLSSAAIAVGGFLQIGDHAASLPE